MPSCEPMRPRVTVHVGPDTDLCHTSLVLTGLSMLAARGAIDLRYRLARDDRQWLAADPVVLCLEADGPSGQLIALDLRDGEGVSHPIVDRADRYLKRAFRRREYDRLPAPLTAKMQPFGLNFPCRNMSSTISMLGTLGLPLVGRGWRAARLLRQYLRTPPPAMFEQPPEVVVEPTVIFQTRLWTADEVPQDEVESLNTERLSMVRALRRAFGTRFIGGVMPTPFALANHADEVTPHSAKKAAYVALNRRSLIAVYTPGVEQSAAFKLGETLAASQCLVSVPLQDELPEPLIAGRHYLGYSSTEECVEACRQLLAEPERATRMRLANHEYYIRQVEPAAHVTRVLERCGVLPAS